MRDGKLRIIATSGKGYVSKWNFERALDNVKREVPGARIVSVSSKVV